MVKVPALTSDLLILLSQEQDREALAFAALLEPGDTTLRLRQRLLGFAGVAWVGYLLATCQRQERFQTQVDAGFFSRQWQRLYRRAGTGEAGIPTIGFFDNAD